MTTLSGRKDGQITNKFFISNKVKEVSFKILHRIYPVKELFERFKLDIENSCDFCGVVKESVTHLFVQCMYSRLFWVDVSNFISRMFGTIIHIGMYDVIFFCTRYHWSTFRFLEVNFFLTQLIILLGKYQRNGLKLSQNVNIFLKKLNNMVLLWTILETEKWKRPMKHYVSLIWLIKYFYFFPGKD